MSPCARRFTLSDYPRTPRKRALRNLPKPLGLVLLCLMQCVFVSTSHAEPLKLGLGIVAGGRFGSDSTEDSFVFIDAPAETVQWARHWLLGGEIAARGAASMFGLRTSFSHYNASDGYPNTLFRFGPFLGGTFFKRPVGAVALGLFAEGSLYLDTRLRGRPWDDGASHAFAFVPGAGGGVELSMLGALRINLYGGVNYTESLDERYSSYWGGEVRTAVLYVFGERLRRAAAVSAAPP